MPESSGCRVRRARSPFFLKAAGFLFGSVMAAGALPVAQEWYVPQPEEQLRQDYAVLATGLSTIAETVIAITVPVPGTQIVVDHWEDGYEIDLGNPTQANSQIWGDGNNANGKPPGYANDPASFTAGSVIILRNQVPLPRNPSVVLYDGRDRLGSTAGIVMTRAAWFTNPGPLLANSVEVRAVQDWGKSFVLPVGENLIFPTPATASMFEHCSAYIMAAQDGTQVQLDLDANGTTDSTFTLNRGESRLVNAGIKTGATVTATKPVQVIEFYGDVAANYESRGANVPPLDKWSTEYYAPVGTASDGDETYIFLYNPDPAAITIDYTTRVGSGSFVIPAKSTYRFLMPQNSAARFVSPALKPFWGIGTVGARPTANNVHDWGYALVPSDFLTTEIVVGWGAGSDDGTQNGSPVWVTSPRATRIYVDYNGDRNGPLTDPNGGKYDVALDVAPLAVSRVFDPDKDQSAMRLYTLDGTLITAAWGQDPAVAGPSRPFLDLGNTTPNFPVPVMTKRSTVVTDNAPAGLSIGDVLEYTIRIDNRSLLSLSSIPLLDTLPAGVAYVAGSTTRDGLPVADNPTGTAFPIDGAGLVIPIVQARASTTVAFRVTVTASGTLTNTVEALGYSGLKATDTVVVPAAAGSNACGLTLTDAAGTETDFQTGAGIHVTLDDPDANTSVTAVNTVDATVENLVNGDLETLVLTETGVNTGIFRNTTALPSSTSTGLQPEDGTLNAAAGDSISASHTDPLFGDVCTDVASITAPGLQKQLYLSTDGADNDTTGILDRISPADVSPADTTTSQSAILAVPAPAGVSYVTTRTNSVASGNVTISNVAPTGSDRLMLVGISWKADSASAITNVTFGGTPLTSVGTSFVGNDHRVDMYRLVNPATNSTNVVVSFNGTTKGSYVAVSTLTGVDQTTPLGTRTNATGDNTVPSVTAASAAGDLVFDVLTSEKDGTAVTVGTNQTSRWTTGATNVGEIRSAGSTEPATGTNTVMSWSNPGKKWALSAVAIKPSTSGGGGGGTNSATFTQTPSFAETFSLSGTPAATVYYTVTTGSMPASPSISAVLRKNGTAFATNNSVSATNGLLTFGFPSGQHNFAASDAISLVVTTAQTNLGFRLDYDSSTKPSKITLPTTTVIRTDTVAVYDAPYPGGNLVSTPTIGRTLYVRATVGDPFGAYDITSLDLAIDGPGSAGDIATTLGDGSVVATNAASKTYEYTWSTGATEGTFNITATAKEGFENTITSAKSTTVNFSSLDLGTPSTTEFTTGNNGPHTLTYTPDEFVYVRVVDLDENTDPNVAETITVVITGSGGDTETVTLTETGPNTGIFTGGLPSSSTVTGTSGNGTLYALPGAVLVVNYVDNDDPTDTGSDTATIPNTSPSVAVTKTLLSPAEGRVSLGGTAQFRIRVINNGNSTLSTVQVVDTFTASQLSYTAATPAPDATAAGSLTWNNVGPLTPGQSVDILVDFTGAGAADPSTNSVNVTTGGGPTASDSETIVIVQPALTVIKTVVSPLPGPASKGDNVVFDISVQNTGTTALATVPLEDSYSSALFDFVSATVAPDSVGAGSLLWNDITGAGNLAVGATFNVSVTLRAKGAAMPATNTAAVNFAVDANGDSVPPAESSDGIETAAAAISGTVYEDRGSPGFGGDIALPGATVRLFTDPNGDGDPADGQLVALTTSDAAGFYEFLNLALASYVVVQQDPVGFTSVADTVGANDNRIPVNVTALATYGGNDFLDALIDTDDYGTIEGQVRNDTDADGDLSDSEAGLAGAGITLYTDPNGDGSPSDGLPYALPVTTGAGGTYSFTNIPPGSYVVVETDPATFVSTADAANPNDNYIPVTLAASQTSSGNDFLDTDNTAALATLGNLVWNDANGNGLYDIGETGIDGVTVQLYRAAQTPGVGSPYLSTTTAGGGLYGFSNVAVGSYRIFIPASNFAPGGPLATTPLAAAPAVDADDATDNDSNGLQAGGTGTAVNSPAIALAAGETDDTKDFGFVVQPGSISGTVLIDTTGDGTGDQPVSGITLALVDSSGNPVTDGSGNPVTVTTNSNGEYVFPNVPAGTYGVKKTNPPNFRALSDKDGGDPNYITAIVVTNDTESSGNNFVLQNLECPNTWPNWQAIHTNLPNTNITGNNDGDMQQNLFEYAFCMDPENGEGSPYCLVASLSNAATQVDLVFSRTLGGATDITYELQSATNLTTNTTWTTLPLPTNVIVTTNYAVGDESVRVPNLGAVTGLTNSGFIRMKVTLASTNPSENGATMTGEVGGWIKTPLTTNNRTFNDPFISCPAWSGTVGSVSGNNVVVPVPVPSGNADLSFLGTGTDEYYVEILSGAFEGQRFDIAGGSTNTITIDPDSALNSVNPPYNTMLGAPPAGLTNAPFVVRKHRTLGSLFPSASLVGSGDPTTGSLVQFTAGTTNTVNNTNGAGWVSYWFSSAVTLSNVWAQVGDINLTSQMSKVIPPGQGSFLQARTNGTFMLFGKVRANDFVSPLAQGLNLFGGGYPLVQSPAGRVMNRTTGFFATNNFPLADQFMMWGGDTNAALNSYVPYYLLYAVPTNTNRPTLLQWTRNGDNTLVNVSSNNLFVPDYSMLIRVQSAITNYTTPLPWGPGTND